MPYVLFLLPILSSQQSHFSSPRGTAPYLLSSLGALHLGRQLCGLFWGHSTVGRNERNAVTAPSGWGTAGHRGTALGGTALGATDRILLNSGGLGLRRGPNPHGSEVQCPRPTSSDGRIRPRSAVPPKEHPPKCGAPDGHILPANPTQAVTALRSLRPTIASNENQFRTSRRVVGGNVRSGAQHTSLS